MKDLGGSSFYDSLNKMVIGFLLLWPGAECCQELYPTDEFHLILFSVLCWIVGLLFWGLIEYGIMPFMQRIPLYRTNNLDCINEMYAFVSKKTGKSYVNKLGVSLTNLDLYDYYTIYFEVQKKGLLGAVPQLECFSAFFRNFTFVLIWWSLIIITHLWPPFIPKGYTPAEMTAAIVIVYCLFGFSLYFRYRIEKRIFRSIFEAYFLG